MEFTQFLQCNVAMKMMRHGRESRACLSGKIERTYRRIKLKTWEVLGFTILLWLPLDVLLWDPSLSLQLLWSALGWGGLASEAWIDWLKGRGRGGGGEREEISPSLPAWVVSSAAACPLCLELLPAFPTGWAQVAWPPHRVLPTELR